MLFAKTRTVAKHDVKELLSALNSSLQTVTARES
uniref:Bm14452 n=1 Tax=Brugia malayi TaxID=6279 RepID=A0A0J9XPF4_BRUMA|nr:Bm14452 [Brugia malayi]